MAEPALESSDLVRKRLTRFLHTGNQDIPKYFPGCWTSHKYFEPNKLDVLNEALANGMNNVEVVNIILKAYKDGWYTRFETIAFALCKCLLLGSPSVKEATYRAAAEVCRTPEQMMLFNKFTRLMKTGNGRGWCKHVKQWYTSKEPMELAKEMSRVKARHGRSHKTLIRKSHVKVDPEDHARDAVVKYAIFGLKKAKQLMADKQGTKEVFDYIQKVEDLRHCEDGAAAAATAAANQFTLDHVPGHMLTNKDVWDAILPQFSLEELLNNIQRIHNMGFLTDDSTTTAIVLSLLNNPDLVKKSKLTPLAVHIAYCNYQVKSRPMKHDKAKVAKEKEQRRRVRQIFNETTGLWEWTVTRKHPKEIKHWGIDLPPNPSVLMALDKLIDQTWFLTPPTNKRYLITMDMRSHMFKGRHMCKRYVLPKKCKKIPPKAPPPLTERGDAPDPEKKSKKREKAECFYNKHVTPGDAAILLALQIFKREKNCQLAIFTEQDIEIVTFNRDTIDLKSASEHLRLKNNHHGRVQLDAPMAWAAANNKHVDVFINMVDRTTRYMELDKADRGGRGPGGRYGPPPPDGVRDRCPVRALQRYRQDAVPDAKLVVMSLASHRVQSTNGSHDGVLDVVGVDEYVPKLLDAFALGQFY